MSTGLIRFAAVAVVAVLALADAASAYYSPALGRFLSRDPIGEPGSVLVRQAARQATSFIPRDRSLARREPNRYAFVMNHPTNSYDVLGLQTANPTIPMCKLGSSWAVLTFDGLTLNGWEAVSGMPVSETSRIIENNIVNTVEERTTVFDYSTARQKLSGQGPTPEGGYWFDVCEERSGDTSWWSHGVRTNAWGRYSWSLHPWPTTQTYGRDGMFIHGGGRWDSHGCIDIKHNDVSLHNLVDQIRKQNGCCCYVNVNVKYAVQSVTKIETFSGE